MTTDKRKEQLRKAQAKVRADNTEKGWVWLRIQVPTWLRDYVKQKLKEEK